MEKHNVYIDIGSVSILKEKKGIFSSLRSGEPISSAEITQKKRHLILICEKIQPRPNNIYVEKVHNVLQVRVFFEIEAKNKFDATIEARKIMDKSIVPVIQSEGLRIIEFLVI